MIPVTETNAEEVLRVLKGFTREFPESEIKLKPAMVKGNRCLALAYIDARLVMDRLDEVVGINGWKDEYTVLSTGEVECRLSVRIAGEWIAKADVGGQSEQPDEGDRMKSAFSDALKRAAVKFGIGRFLYRRPQQWMDYDPVKKQIVRAAQPHSKPAPQQPALQQPPKEHPLLAQWRVRVEAAPDRAMLIRLWKEFEAAAVPDDVRGAIVLAFKDAGKRFPQPAQA